VWSTMLKESVSRSVLESGGEIIEGGKERPTLADASGATNATDTNWKLMKQEELLNSTCSSLPSTNLEVMVEVDLRGSKRCCGRS
jgi:hypothetical protein